MMDEDLITRIVLDAARTGQHQWRYEAMEEQGHPSADVKDEHDD